MLLLVKTWLEKKDRSRWLMVIDNADDMQLFFGASADASSGSASTESRHVGKLERYIPECAHGSLLITTRNKQAGLRLAKGNPPIVVCEMDDTESEKLLRTKLNENPTSDELWTLSSRLERLPLTLVQAAAFIETNTITVSEYLRRLDKSDQDLVDLLSEEFETDGRDSETPRAVAETWILSFEQIQQQNPFAGELLSLMSLFDRQAIPSEFLSRYNEQQGQEAWGGTMLTKALRVLKAFSFVSKQQGQEARGELQLTKALGILKAFSFVVEEKDQSWGMHRLVQLVTRKWLAKKGRMRHFAGQALLAVSHCYPFGRYENWAICGAYLAHAHAVLGSEGTGSRDEKAAKVTLLHCVAAFCSYQGQWKDAERFQLEAVELFEELLGSEHPSTLLGKNNLASIYSDQGRWEEAEKLFMQVLGNRKTKLGVDDLNTMASLGNLASTYMRQGRWEEAEKLEVQVMESRKTKLGANHPHTLTSMGNLASMYKAQCRWEEAEKLEVQVIESRKTKLGANHPSTLTTMNNLALTWKGQGRHTDALALMEECAQARQRVLGAKHPDTLASLEAVAVWSS